MSLTRTWTERFLHMCCLPRLDLRGKESLPPMMHEVYPGFLGGGGGGGGGKRGHLPPLKKVLPPPPLESKRPSSYTARCVFMLHPKISHMCGSPLLVKLSE